MIRFIVRIFVLGTAVMVATVLVVVAHFGLGIARSTIRTDALVGIIFVGIALAGSCVYRKLDSAIFVVKAAENWV
jgi:hypothetical protein